MHGGVVGPRSAGPAFIAAVLSCTVLVVMFFVPAVAGAPVARVAASGVVSGTLAGPLPKTGSGEALVSVVSLSDFRVVAARTLGRTGTFSLSVPAGTYALVATVVSFHGAIVSRAVAVSVRSGQRRTKLRLSVKKPKKKKTRKKRPGARAAYVQQSGKATTGVAYTVENFTGATGDLSVLNRGLTDMLAADLAGSGKAGCPSAEVANSSDRKLLQAELDLSNSPAVDPSTKLKRDFIVPDITVRGTLQAAADQKSVGYVITLEDSRTGEVFDTLNGSLSAASFSGGESSLAKTLGGHLCHGPPPGPEPGPQPTPTRPAPTTPTNATKPPVPTSFTVDMNVTAGYAQVGDLSVSGTVQGTINVPWTLVGFWSATGQVAFSNISLTSNVIGCSFGNPASITPDWPVHIQADEDDHGVVTGYTVLAWVPNVELTGDESCGGDPPLTERLLGLDASTPALFHLPVSGSGSVDITSGDPSFFTIAGTVTVTPHY